VTRTPTDLEAKLLRTQQELAACSALTVNGSRNGEVSELQEEMPVIFTFIPGWEDVIFSRELCVRSARITELGTCWYHPAAADAPEISGEFCITDLFTAIRKRPPELAWNGSSDEERELISELRMVDDTSLSALGKYGLLRIQAKTDPWEMWYYDLQLMNPDEGRTTQFVKLDLTYPEYLEQLAITKGTLGWQYLFTDLSLDHEDFDEVKRQLAAMLEVFPRLFPAWDYRDLASRLEVRV
jgi:hypothetical protein